MNYYGKTEKRNNQRMFRDQVNFDDRFARKRHIKKQPIPPKPRLTDIIEPDLPDLPEVEYDESE